MYLLDSDILSNAWDERRDHRILRDRIEKEPRHNVLTSVITAEELLLHGILPELNKARRLRRGILEAYAAFTALLGKLRGIGIVPYDAPADLAFQAIPESQRRAHPSDCRIAATAIARGLIVVTQNTRHFEVIAGVRYTDWTADLPVVLTSTSADRPERPPRRPRR